MLLLSKYVVENQSNGLFNYTPDEKKLSCFLSKQPFFRRELLRKRLDSRPTILLDLWLNDIFAFKWRTALLTIQFKKNTPEVLTLKK